MSDADQTALNSVYLKLSRKEAKAKRFKQAYTLLDQIAGDDRDDDEIRMLMKKYKRAAGIK